MRKRISKNVKEFLPPSYFYLFLVLLILIPLFFLLVYLYQLKLAIVNLTHSLETISSLKEKTASTCKESVFRKGSNLQPEIISFTHRFFTPSPSVFGFNKNVKSVSFTEIFSGEGWKNKIESSVYQDPLSSIITFPPKIKVSLLNQNWSEQIKADFLSLFAQTYNQEAPPTFLAELEKETGIKLVKAVKIDDFWLLAHLGTEKKKFFLVIYAYDGKHLQKIGTKDFFVSDYPIVPSKILLIGDRNDFLIGFVGWESKLLRFMKTSEGSVLLPGYKILDVSFWVSPRIGGKVKEIRGFKTKTGYFLYDKEFRRVLLITDNIPLEISTYFEKTSFKNALVVEKAKNTFSVVDLDCPLDLVTKNSLSLLFSSLKKAEPKALLTFLGFDFSKPVSFVSSNLRAYSPQSEKNLKVVGAEIAGYLGDRNGGSFEFFFSVDNGKHWQKVNEGEILKFKHKTSNLEWKVKLIPSSENGNFNIFKSPFLRWVKIVYFLKD